MTYHCPRCGTRYTSALTNPDSKEQDESRFAKFHTSSHESYDRENVGRQAFGDKLKERIQVEKM